MYWDLFGVVVTGLVTYTWMRIKLDRKSQAVKELTSDLAYQHTYQQELFGQLAGLKAKLEEAEKDFRSAQGAYTDLHARFEKFRTDTEAICKAHLEERNSLKRELARYGKLMADADEVWYQGPPPYIGWWNASNTRNKFMWRWWNGTCWSLAVNHLEDDVFAALAAEESGIEVAGTIEWRHYYPENARVPRMSPEQWEKS